MAKTPRDAGAPPASRRAATALIIVGSLVASVAHAGLGEPADSVPRDHVALSGVTLRVTPMKSFDVHETTTADGTRVRQYVSHVGTVFAVAWSGRALPALPVVLAKHYDAYLSATKEHRGNHHVLSIATPELVLSVVRLPRGFTGSAYVPALLPPGTSAQELQ
jgi:hypothetical protein